MSMIAYLIRVSARELDSYRNDSSLLSNKLESHFEGKNESSIQDLDKAWEGVYFILTGQALADYGTNGSIHPLAKTIFSESIIDENLDFGYGPATYVTTEEVKYVNNIISEISEQEIHKRFNGSLMQELGIYPEIWDDEDALPYLLENFKNLQDVYAAAAQNNEAVIVFLT
jgi:hypothetical protein